MRDPSFDWPVRSFAVDGGEITSVVAGEGPLVILMHGWPELGYSWRHQIAPLVAAGYQVAAPDMRGYGKSLIPGNPADYSMDQFADDMAAVARGLGAKRWVAVGHDWGSPVAWRCGMRFPDAVAGVFSLSVPHRLGMTISANAWFDAAYPDRFYYMRYFQPIGPAEAELERNPRDALKRIYFSLSGDAPLNDWVNNRPIGAPLLPGLAAPPAGPLSFMTDTELDVYARAFAEHGFFGPLCWYRAWDANETELTAYASQRITMPAGVIAGDKEIVLAMFPGALEAGREVCDDLRIERIVPGAGHWIQQERPEAVNVALVEFLSTLDT